jgi:hypothetical protein
MRCWSLTRPRGAGCPDGAHVTGIAALAVTAQVGNQAVYAWCARMDGRGAPIVTTTDGSAEPIVWAVGAEGDDRLHGFRGDTGEEIYAGAATTGRHDRAAPLRHHPGRRGTLSTSPATGASLRSNCRGDATGPRSRLSTRHGRRRPAIHDFLWCDKAWLPACTDMTDRSVAGATQRCVYRRASPHRAQAVAAARRGVAVWQACPRPRSTRP